MIVALEAEFRVSLLAADWPGAAEETRSEVLIGLQPWPPRLISRHLLTTINRWIGRGFRLGAAQI